MNRKTEQLYLATANTIIMQKDLHHGFRVFSSGDSASWWKYFEKPGSWRLVVMITVLAMEVMVNMMMMVIMFFSSMINDDE